MGDANRNCNQRAWEWRLARYLIDTQGLGRPNGHLGSIGSPFQYRARPTSMTTKSQSSSVGGNAGVGKRFEFHEIQVGLASYLGA